MTEEDFKEIISLKNDGKMKHREGKKLEYKANFNFGSMNEYSKTMAAFANTSGGIIVFGVKDRPRKPEGLTNDNFSNTDPEKITSYLNEHYAPEIIWEADEFEIEGKKFAIIEVKESSIKPIVCIKNSKTNKEREGDIFYRYSGRSERIKYPELRKMLDDNVKNEQKKWMEHLENISKIGPQNIMLVDLMRGEIPSNTTTKILIDKELLKEMKIVQEGRLVEKDGAPALTLVGNVEGVETVVPKFNLEDDFYTTKQLAEELGLLTGKGSTHYMTAVIWKYNIQDKEEYYQHKGIQKLYSKLALDYLKSLNISLEQAKKIAQEYNKRNRHKR